MARKPKVSETPKLTWSHAVPVLKGYVEHGYNVLLTGMPGIGKTAMAELLAHVLGYDMVVFHPVISDPTDFKGMPWIFKDKNGKEHCVFVPFDQLKMLTEAQGPVLCLLDDMGQAPDAVQAACMQLIWGGKINGIKLSKHVRFMACTNRKSDRAGVGGILEPVKSRFHGIFELEPELEPWIAHMIQHKNINPLFVAFMRQRPEWLTGGSTGWAPTADIVNQACPRTLEYLSDVINLKHPKELRPTTYAGAVGKGMANEYFAFEQLLLRMPDLDVVCKNPSGAEAPNSPDIQYAMLGALHHRADRSNLDNIYKYLGLHFAKELQVVFHNDLEKFQPKLQTHQAFTSWSAKNGDYLAN